MSPPQTQADFKDDINEQYPDRDKELREFCNRRKGDQMNLETWYSGKCGGSFEESIGFSDIIILDLYERIAGERKDGDSLFDLIDTIREQQNNNLNSTSSPIDLSEFGIVGSVASLITKTYSNPPASSIDYIAHVNQNLKDKRIVSDAIAADEGIGFVGLSPVLQLWKMVRNIAYFFFIILFIVIGFAIMFRVKINPQTVIGIQTVLPKFIALLLLITFSYAIVGLLIDLMYLVFFLIMGLFESNNIINQNNAFVAMSTGRFGLLLSFITNGITAGLVGVGSVISLILGVPMVVGLAANVAIGVLGGWILNVIVILAVLIAYVKMFFTLIKSYIGIILKLIFSPIILLGGVFPGSNTIGGWFRGLIADLSVFPTTMVCLVLAYFFMVQGLQIPGAVQNTEGAFSGAMKITGYITAPPILSPWGVAGQDSHVIFPILGLALLLMASKYAEMIKDALKVPPFKYGAAIGEALMFGAKQSGAADLYGGYQKLEMGERVKSLGKKVQGLSKIPGVDKDSLGGASDEAKEISKRREQGS